MGKEFRATEADKARWISDVTECLRIYDILGLWGDAEEVIRTDIVREFVKKVCTSLGSTVTNILFFGRLSTPGHLLHHTVLSFLTHRSARGCVSPLPHHKQQRFLQERPIRPSPPLQPSRIHSMRLSRRNLKPQYSTTPMTRSHRCTIPFCASLIVTCGALWRSPRRSV